MQPGQLILQESDLWSHDVKRFLQSVFGNLKLDYFITIKLDGGCKLRFELPLTFNNFGEGKYRSLMKGSIAVFEWEDFTTALSPTARRETEIDLFFKEGLDLIFPGLFLRPVL